MSSILRKDLRSQVAELIVIRASGHSLDSQREYPQWEISNKTLKELLELGVGGVILYGGNIQEISDRCKTIKKWSNKKLLLCADVEEGLGQRFRGGSWLIPPMGLGLIHQNDSKSAISFAEKYGQCVGDEARRCGLNWVLAPVCDVNSNSENPVINMRAWGDRPEIVAPLVCAFHKGLSSMGVLSCAKHFPGHGDTHVDSHLELPIVEHDISRLEEIELIPFKEVIDQGVNSVMTAHLLLKNIDDGNPATFSKKILNKILRNKLGFKGLIVTDALIMKAITKSYGTAEAAVMAFNAGSDLILMPENPYKAINAIVDSLVSGQISMNKLEKALERRRNELSKTEIKTPVSNDSYIDLDQLQKNKYEHLEKDLIEISMQVRKKRNFKNCQEKINLIRVDGVFPSPFLSNLSPSLSIPEKLGYKNIVCHPLGISPWQDDFDEPLALDRLGEGALFIQLFLRGNPFRGNQDIKEPWVNALKQLQRHNRLAGIAVFGSIYLWKDLLSVLDPNVLAAYSPGQMPSAQEKVLQALFNDEKNDFKSNHYEFTT